MKSYVLLILVLFTIFFIGTKISSTTQRTQTTVANAANLTCSSCCPLHSIGDVDCNGTIDGIDFEIWRKGRFGEITVTPTSGIISPTISTNPTSMPTSTPIPTTGVSATPVPTIPVTACQRPYSSDSPWNSSIGANPQYDAQNTQFISSLTGLFGSDPTQYTLPVYEVTNATPMKTVKLSGRYSVVKNNGQTLDLQTGGPTVQIPIPAGAQVAAGTDAQIVIWNKQTGDEYALWQAAPQANGTWTAVNGYKYNTNWSGVPPVGFWSRGPGITYLAGLIRPCEIAQGHIDHVIAFAYQNTATAYVYPATKSDGGGNAPPAIPEGARLQLDPTLTDAQLSAKGCTGACLIVAHALQQYGMIVADTSGHPKIYPEYEGTAHWNGAITASTVSKIPLSSFKLIKLPPLQQ